jgi:hypothetical protein
VTEVNDTMRVANNIILLHKMGRACGMSAGEERPYRVLVGK